MVNPGLKAQRDAAEALRIAKSLRAQREIKHNTENSAITNVLDTGTIFCLNDVPQGDGNYQRDGTAIYCYNLYVKGRLTADASGSSYQRVRYIIARFEGEHGASPTLTDLMGSATPDVCEFKDWDNRLNFKVLKDDLLLLHPIASNVGPPSIHYEFKLRVKRKTWFAEASSQPERGGIWLFVWSNQPAAGAVGPQLDQYSRLTYTDS